MCSVELEDEAEFDSGLCCLCRGTASEVPVGRSHLPSALHTIGPSVPHVVVVVRLAIVQFIIWVPASSVPGFLPLESPTCIEAFDASADTLSWSTIRRVWDRDMADQVVIYQKISKSKAN